MSLKLWCTPDGGRQPVTYNNIHECQNYKAKGYYPDHNCRVPAHQSKLIEFHGNLTHVKIKI
jgi:hypothetical protein